VLAGADDDAEEEFEIDLNDQVGKGGEGGVGRGGVGWGEVGRDQGGHEGG
jgi:hypothetical protein